MDLGTRDRLQSVTEGCQGCQHWKTWQPWQPSVFTGFYEIISTVKGNMINKQTSKKTPKASDLRDRLKTIVEKELDGLSETLDGLTGKERLDVILKLMPLVVPKSKPVHYSEGEPWSIG